MTNSVFQSRSSTTSPQTSQFVLELAVVYSQIFTLATPVALEGSVVWSCYNPLISILILFNTARVFGEVFLG